MSTKINIYTGELYQDQTEIAAGSIGITELSSNVNEILDAGISESLIIPLGSYDDDATLLTDEPLLGREFPFTGTIQSISLSLKTPPVGSSFIVDIKKNSTSIFSTLLSVDSGETSSETAAVPFVLSTTTITAGDLLTFSVTQVGATESGIYPVISIQIIRT